MSDHQLQFNPTSFFTDLHKLYTHELMDPDINPQTLQNKVQWDLRFYFARRANENIEKFTKGTFKMMQHQESSLRYIVKCYDEQTKNHQMDLTDIQTACMVKVPDSRYCPVKSFLKYKEHLSPLVEFFWQYPKEKGWKKSDVWYTNKCIGANPLSTFMSTLSHDADLAKMYTNHSIRVTGTTYLTRKEFSPKQIMSITGHKSLNSLAIYQKVSTDEKLAMAYAMSCYLHSDQSLPMKIGPIAQNSTDTEVVPVCTAPSATVTTPQPILQEVPENRIVTYESEDPFADAEIPDFDLGQIMETIKKENTIMTQTASEGVSTRTNFLQQCQYVQKRSPQIPIFNNSKIRNINITINKN